MLYLEQKFNRIIFMSISTIASVALLAVLIEGINAVGVFMGAAIINFLVYYSLPDKFSKHYMEKQPNRFTPRFQKNPANQTVLD